MLAARATIRVTLPNTIATPISTSPKSLIEFTSLDTHDDDRVEWERAFVDSHFFSFG